MSKSQEGDRQARRRRQLNVIYFVDSARTRTFKMPLSRLNTIVGLAVLLVGWSIVSTFLLMRMAEDRQQLSEQYTASLESIFKFETLHNNAFEIAYGKKKPTLQPRPAAQPVAVKELDKVGAKETPKPKKMALTTNSVVPSAKIEVQDASASIEGGGIRLIFKIINQQSPQKVTGYVHAIATIKTTSGEVIHLGAPTGIAVSSQGVAAKPKNAYRFSIKRYKVKKFKFNVPNDVKGQVTAMKIEVSDAQGAVFGVFNVPVSLKIN